MSEYIDQLKSYDAYRNYLQQKEKLKQFPALRDAVLRVREITEIMQEDVSAEEEERLRAEFDTLNADPVVHDFMQAEIDYCRMFQEIRSAMAAELGI